MNKRLLYSILLSMFLSELILVVNPKAGFVSYFILVTGILFFLSKKEKLDDLSKILIVLMILPAIRIAGFFIELEFFWKVIVSSIS